MKKQLSDVIKIVSDIRLNSTERNILSFIFIRCRDIAGKLNNGKWLDIGEMYFKTRNLAKSCGHDYSLTRKTLDSLARRGFISKTRDPRGLKIKANFAKILNKEDNSECQNSSNLNDFKKTDCQNNSKLDCQNNSKLDCQNSSKPIEKRKGKENRKEKSTEMTHENHMQDSYEKHQQELKEKDEIERMEFIEKVKVEKATEQNAQDHVETSSTIHYSNSPDFKADQEQEQESEARQYNKLMATICGAN